MTGKDLIEVINENKLQDFPIKDTLLLLLERKMIRPSEIIDAYGEYMDKMVHVYKSHYEESCVAAHQLLNGFFKGADLIEVKKRCSYNASFSRYLNRIEPLELTDEERDKWSEIFERNYGFRPENIVF